MQWKKRLRKIDEIYRQLPTIQCQGKCSESCGPILMSDAEEKRIVDAVGHEPDFGPDLKCNLLQCNRCSVYEIRPLICRLWGLVKAMRCPFGCVPDRWLPEEESRRLLKENGELGFMKR